MLNITKTGNVTIKNPLPKTSKSNKQPSIVVTTNHNINKPMIIDNGKKVNEEEIRTRTKKLNAIKNKYKLKINERDFTPAKLNLDLRYIKALVARMPKKNEKQIIETIQPNIENISKNIKNNQLKQINLIIQRKY